jgi:hypothetical protein
MSYIPRFWRQIVPISIAIPGGSTVASQSLTTALLNVSNAILIPQHSITHNAVSGLLDPFYTAYAVITNVSTISASVGAAGTGTVTWSGVLIEFIGSFIKSGASGTIAVADGSNSGTATITAVNTSNTILSCTGGYTTGPSLLMGGNVGNDITPFATFNVLLTNATTLTANWDASSNGNFHGRAVGYSYVETR